ncbi:MAG: YciI family protein [Ilumatobacter sp.]
MLIAFQGLDRADAGELRASLRPAHIEFHRRRNNLVGGPLIDDDGNMCGSLIIFEAEDIADATKQLASDPYIERGLFDTVSITEFIAADWPSDTSDDR